eukprot:CAMPEP_0172935916 /NCGR_PEP_ID=MMETSP1075-20121228/221754_1 /TAXON_ID=2916 /ORGANISM="Ceratium fusus, Strain PA161109" /LENGTH=623 /DNA_ID=CAMNT_0013797279 /DNA_START=1273 /DNA_END=3145 /DNA_ORIENTATION=+
MAILVAGAVLQLLRVDFADHGVDILQSEESLLHHAVQVLGILLGALVHDAEAFASFRSCEAGPVVIFALELIAVIMLLLAVVVTPEDATFQLPWAAPPALSAAFFIVAGSSSGSWSHSLLGNWVMVAIGRLSYPLYLWHWPVMALSDFGLLYSTGQDPSWLAGFFMRILQGILTFILAVATSKFEDTVRTFRPRPTWKTYAVLGSLLLATACWLGLLYGPLSGTLYVGSSQLSGSAHPVHQIDRGGQPHHKGNHSRSIPKKVANMSATNELSTPNTFASTASTTKKPQPTVAPNPCSCCKHDKALHVPPNASGNCGKDERPCFVGKRPYRKWFGGPFQESCWCSKAGTCTARVAKCLTPDRGRDGNGRAMFLIGDSHATMYVTVAKCLTPDRGRDGNGRAMFLIGDSHATMYVTALREAIGDAYSLSFTTRNNSECFRLNTTYPNYCAAVLNGVSKNLRSGDVLALTFATWQFSPYKLHKVRIGSLNNIREYTLVLESWHRLVLARNATMILLGDQTPLTKPGLQCVSTSFNQDAVGACSRTVEWSDLYGGHLRDQMHLLERAWPTVHFFDPRALFCTKQACGAMVPGTRTLATGDLDHLTIEGSYYLWPFLCSFLHKKGLLG